MQNLVEAYCQQLISQFYQDLQKWVELGTPTGNTTVFKKHLSLCANFSRWVDFWYETQEEMKEKAEQFEEEGLYTGYFPDLLKYRFHVQIDPKGDNPYPFNSEGRCAYAYEAHVLKNFYLNQDRLDWIKQHVLEFF
jgi:hypothetical protein